MSGDGPQPLVSVVMATFNCASTLPVALESIAQQTYENWELVACDDGSSDASYAVLREFAECHPGRVTLLRNEVNSRLAASLNRCLEVASGDYIARMDGDDACAPERLAEQVLFLQAHPDVDAVGTAMRRFSEEGWANVLTLEDRVDRWSLRRGVPFAHPTVMLRQHTYQLLEGYTVSRRTERAEDLDLWFRFAAAGFIGANLKAPLYFYREDLDALRRRTARSRLDLFRLTIAGFRTLGYPKRWYVGAFVALGKALVPATFVRYWRRAQAWMYIRSASELGVEDDKAPFP